MLYATLRVFGVLLVGSMTFSGPALAAELSNYTVAQLLKPCVEGDNDARWGAEKEAECEQFIGGFTDTYLLLTNSGRDKGVCLPSPGNRRDEVRWAFMKWAYQNFDRRYIPAVEGLSDTVKVHFPCQ